MLVSNASRDALLGSDESNDDDDLIYNKLKTYPRHFDQSYLILNSFDRFLTRAIKGLRIPRRHHLLNHSHSGYSRRIRRIFFLTKCIFASITIIVLFTAAFRPSYTHRPGHYSMLQTRAESSILEGRANPFNERIFIAISLYDKDGHLAGGRWGEQLLELIDLLGPSNVFLSIYQSDSGNGTALETFKSKIICEHSIVNDQLISKDDFPTVTMPDGSQRVKRVLYLAEMRNKALRPLDKTSSVKYDKILFLNDIYFRPLDAAQLLFSTNVSPESDRAQYLAACALDFGNPFKFYDLFVTRDLEGYSMGLPFFPIFANAGRAHSRKDMLAQKDAVRARSCWSGMVALQARFVQSDAPSVPLGFQDIGAHVVDPEEPRNVTAPVRFRAEPGLFFDACECCLFLADLQRVALNAQDNSSFTSTGTPSIDDLDPATSIFVNPFIRVSYSATVLSWLPATRRIERLFALPHRLATILARLPTANPHRTVREGDVFQEDVWTNPVPGPVPRRGSWSLRTRTGRNGLLCGVREMQVLQRGPRTGDTNWRHWPVPGGQNLFFPT